MKFVPALDYNGLTHFKQKNDEKYTIHYVESSTAAGTAAKTASLTGFTLATGRMVAVKFTNSNTAANPTLNINSTGAKPIYCDGAAIDAWRISAGRMYIMRYNGTQYEVVGGVSDSSTLREVPFSIATGDWTLSNGVYSAEFSTAFVTTTSKEMVTFGDSYRSYVKADISVSKKTGGGGMVFSTAKQPTGTISGTIYALDANDGQVAVVMQDTVVPVSNGGTGGSTVALAQENLGLVPTTATNITTTGYVADARAVKALSDQIANLIHKVESSGTIQTSTSYTYTGKSVTIPAKSYFFVRASCTYVNSIPTGTVISRSSDPNATFERAAGGDNVGLASFCGYASSSLTLCLIAKYGSAASNYVELSGGYITVA